MKISIVCALVAVLALSACNQRGTSSASSTAASTVAASTAATSPAAEDGTLHECMVVSYVYAIGVTVLIDDRSKTDPFRDHLDSELDRVGREQGLTFEEYAVALDVALDEAVETLTTMTTTFRSTSRWQTMRAEGTRTCQQVGMDLDEIVRMGDSIAGSSPEEQAAAARVYFEGVLHECLKVTYTYIFGLVLVIDDEAKTDPIVAYAQQEFIRASNENGVGHDAFLAIFNAASQESADILTTMTEQFRSTARWRNMQAEGAEDCGRIGIDLDEIVRRGDAIGS